MEQLMRSNLKNDWGILELQNAILNIARYIHNFCEDKNIKYCIIGGTALGAVRHGGFIPWDDDLDVFMTLDDYEKFRKLFNECGDKENFYLQEIGESNGRIACAKLRCNNSTYIEESLKDKDIHHGIFVDIFIIHNCPKHRFGQYWIMFWENYIVFKDLANRGYKKRGKIYASLFKMLRILPKRMLLNFALKQIYRYRNTDCPYYCHMYGKLSLRRGLYDKDIFDHYDLVDFETIKLRCPRNIKKWLSAFYGDYMNIPDMSSIRYAQHSCEWSVDKSFEKRGKGLFIDEKYMLN